MLRTIVAIIVSYIVMALLIFAGLSIVYLILGAERAFRPGSFETSNHWLALFVTVNFVVAIIGGFLCATIAKNGKAPFVLAIGVLVLGFLLSIPPLLTERPNVSRRPNATFLEAMPNAKEPTWIPISLPILNAIGVVIGGKLKRRT